MNDEVSSNKSKYRSSSKHENGESVRFSKYSDQEGNNNAEISSKKSKTRNSSHYGGTYEFERIPKYKEQ